MRRIYTRTGDTGMTSINGGGRVAKYDVRIEAVGSLDELNVAIGTARTFMATDHKWQSRLKDVQLTLMAVMSHVATPSEARADNPNRLSESLVEDIERFIDEVAADAPVAEHFILPGGTHLAAFLHQSRVTARRAERRLWALNAVDPVSKEILQYVNRLSDLFFIMARCEMLRDNVEEERWHSFAYKRVKK